MNLPMHQPARAANDDEGIDPVCGMTVNRPAARAAGLSTTRGDMEYVFCGRGCRREFLEDPIKYLDPEYKPSM